MTDEDIFSRAAELEGQRVMVQDGRIFAAADRSAGLKIGAVFLPLRTIVSSGDLRCAWEHCGGIAPVDECRVSVTGTLVRNELGEPELHDVALEMMRSGLLV